VGARPRGALRRAELRTGRDHRQPHRVVALAPAGRVAVLFKVVQRAQDQVVVGVAGERRVAQREGAARHDAGRGRFGVDALVLRLPLLLADARVELTVAVLNKAPRPLVVVNPARLRRRRVLPRLEHPRVRLAEVVVVQAVDARRDPLGYRPCANPLFIRRAAGGGGVIGDRLIAGERLVLLRRVEHHQRVLLRVVAEEEVDPLQLHQARDKVVAALLVLHAVLPRAVVPRQPVLHVDPVLAEHGFDDVRQPLVLEDALVAVALQRPQVGLHHQGVHRVARAVQVGAVHLHRGDFAVEVARRGGQRGGGNGQRDRLAEHRPAVKARVGAEQRHGQLKAARDHFHPLQLPELQGAVSGGGGGGNTVKHR